MPGRYLFCRGQWLSQPLTQQPRSDGRPAPVQEAQQCGIGSQISLIRSWEQVQGREGSLVKPHHRGERIDAQCAGSKVRWFRQQLCMGEQGTQRFHALLLGLLLQVTGKTTAATILQQADQVLLYVHLLQCFLLDVFHGNSTRLRDASHFLHILWVLQKNTARLWMHLQKQRLCPRQVLVLFVFTQLQAPLLFIENGKAIHSISSRHEGAAIRRCSLRF
mmetsp:Transcript_27388/g.63930  ORF Transcript_27388/g.63930 Transcript_27388/m.63930 type:complete len:219 (-) Transcript_27388:57-713(-)